NVVEGNYIGVDKNGNGLIPGTVSWWKAEGNANDAVDGNNGTLVNGTSFAAGEVGQAFSLDGLDDYVQIPDSANLSVRAALSIEAWINPASVSAGEIVTK